MAKGKAPEGKVVAVGPGFRNQVRVCLVCDHSYRSAVSGEKGVGEGRNYCGRLFTSGLLFIGRLIWCFGYILSVSLFCLLTFLFKIFPPSLHAGAYLDIHLPLRMRIYEVFAAEHLLPESLHYNIYILRRNTSVFLAYWKLAVAPRN